ncbi:hypothetical protein RUM43_004904 [Polyplax serrata]|uniref:Uncharacterized protein n=1 Tax=Polyplax serrata TaxID=468196 RepID=A0AAN8SCQ5_POLSC
MDRWIGKVALVTGASAGIGAAIAEELARKGMRVIGLARRIEKLEEMKEKLGRIKGELVPWKGDISKQEEISRTFQWIKHKFGTIHVLVNNAGIARHEMLIDGKIEHFREVLDVNVLGLTLCTQFAYKLMKETGVYNGQIININSTAGSQIPQPNVPKFNIYGASKYAAINALGETLRQELRHLKSKIRVTKLSILQAEHKYPSDLILVEDFTLNRNTQERNAFVFAILNRMDKGDFKRGSPKESSRQTFRSKSGRKTISPGMVEIDWWDTCLTAETAEAREEPRKKPTSTLLKPKDIADSVLYVLSTPPHVQIHELTIKAIGELF